MDSLTSEVNGRNQSFYGKIKIPLQIEIVLMYYSTNVSSKLSVNWKVGNISNPRTNLNNYVSKTICLTLLFLLFVKKKPVTLPNLAKIYKANSWYTILTNKWKDKPVSTNFLLMNHLPCSHVTLRMCTRRINKPGNGVTFVQLTMKILRFQFKRVKRFKD